LPISVLKQALGIDNELLQIYNFNLNLFLVWHIFGKIQGKHLFAVWFLLLMDFVTGNCAFQSGAHLSILVGIVKWTSFEKDSYILF
jgi:hypothetical protein